MLSGYSLFYLNKFGDELKEIFNKETKNYSLTEKKLNETNRLM